jgi:hypothetical protein
MSHAFRLARPVVLGLFLVIRQARGQTPSHLHPQRTQPWFAIHYLGFDPVIDGKRGGDYDKEREKRLRSLGYIK